jgi:hypothetical protein
MQRNEWLVELTQQSAAKRAQLPTRDTPLRSIMGVSGAQCISNTLDHCASNTTAVQVVTAAKHRLQSYPTLGDITDAKHRLQSNPTPGDITDAEPHSRSTSPQKWTPFCQRKPLIKFRYEPGAFRYSNCDFCENRYSEIQFLPHAEN